MVAKPALAYIAGYGRSGSTFLDVVLGAHPAIFSAGEITHLYDDLVSAHPCSCGEPLEKCPVWYHVLGEVRDALPAVTWEQARDVTRHAESLWRGSRLPDETRDEYRLLWSVTMHALRQVSGAAIVVDSSKSQTFAARRPGLLADAGEELVRMVHLTRDPRATAWSVRQGGNPIAAARRLKRLAPLRIVATWTLANVVAEQTSRHLSTLHIRYEDLVADPDGQLARVGEHIGLDMADVVAKLSDGRPMATGHGVHGNRMRTRGPVVLRPDHRWEQEVTVGARLISLLAWPVARRYGYGVRLATGGRR